MERRSGCGRLATPAMSPRSGAASGSQPAPGASATVSSVSTACHGAHTKTPRLYRCRRRSGRELLCEHRPTTTSAAAVATRVTIATTATLAGAVHHSPRVPPRPRTQLLQMVVRRLSDRCRPGCQRTMQTQHSSEIICPEFSPIHHKHQRRPTQHIVPGCYWTSAAYPEPPAAQAAVNIWTLSARP